MSFLIHAVSVSATGREIRRSRRLEDARITVGRDPASDIVLTDLEVTLNHAELIQTGPHRLIVRAVAGIPFTIDGRSTLESEVDARAGTEIRIAGFRLEIAWDEAESAIGVTVERYGLPGGGDEERDERQLFTLVGVAPSRRLLAWAGALIVLLAFVAWPIASYMAASGKKLTSEQMMAGAAGFHGDRSWSAGPLSAAHASLQNNCTACHTKAFVSVRDDSCKTCHASVHDHADPEKLRVALAPDTIGGKLSLAVAHAFNRPAGRCVDCHTEHKGQAMQIAAPNQKFCADCHSDLKAKLPETALGDTKDFGTAHPQFRPAILIQPGANPVFRRTSLDAHPRQETGLLFPHDLHLSATNGVARMAQALGQVKQGGLECAGCHTPDPSGAGFQPVTMEKDCQSCHSLAFGRRDGQVRTLRHGDVAQAIAQVRDFYGAGGGTSVQPLEGYARKRPGDFAAAQLASLAAPGGSTGQAIRALFAPNGTCADCHRITGPSRAGAVDYKIAPVTLPDHFYVNGWFDHRAHATESCASCHNAPKSNDAREVLIPGIATCRNCHVGENGGGIAKKAQVASNCAMCHVYHKDDRRGATAAQRQEKRKFAQPSPAASVRDSG
ncbi:cytochrome c3 family protein [Sphingomonas sp. BIUV-7]|uniref:Cytochrome c3 family protein n=1 Tax=Sphingomonas natans TaxID=3063330 RepID=A0ABT8Y8W9_9SPHN|nr:cytochrome c3 family protein [Sphingomonas sp. BIUV-7]MDO6414776.1 cytochrome c3 family protein [Sphingomonas sp. BIUV-7]